jgi:hypothetical protein
MDPEETKKEILKKREKRCSDELEMSSIKKKISRKHWGNEEKKPSYIKGVGVYEYKWHDIDAL